MLYKLSVIDSRFFLFFEKVTLVGFRSLFFCLLVIILYTVELQHIHVRFKKVAKKRKKERKSVVCRVYY